MCLNIQDRMRLILRRDRVALPIVTKPFCCLRLPREIGLQPLSSSWIWRINLIANFYRSDRSSCDLTLILSILCSESRKTIWVVEIVAGIDNNCLTNIDNHIYSTICSSSRHNRRRESGQGASGSITSYGWTAICLISLNQRIGCLLVGLLPVVEPEPILLEEVPLKISSDGKSKYKHTRSRTLSCIGTGRTSNRSTCRSCVISRPSSR